MSISPCSSPLSPAAKSFIPSNPGPVKAESQTIVFITALRVIFKNQPLMPNKEYVATYSNDNRFHPESITPFVKKIIDLTDLARLQKYSHLPQTMTQPHVLDLAKILIPCLEANDITNENTDRFFSILAAINDADKRSLIVLNDYYLDVFKNSLGKVFDMLINKIPDGKLIELITVFSGYSLLPFFSPDEMDKLLERALTQVEAVDFNNDNFDLHTIGKAAAKWVTLKKSESINNLIGIIVRKINTANLTALKQEFKNGCSSQRENEIAVLLLNDIRDENSCLDLTERKEYFWVYLDVILKNSTSQELIIAIKVASSLLIKPSPNDLSNSLLLKLVKSFIPINKDEARTKSELSIQIHLSLNIFIQIAQNEPDEDKKKGLAEYLLKAMSTALMSSGKPAIVKSQFLQFNTAFLKLNFAQAAWPEECAYLQAINAMDFSKDRSALFKKFVHAVNTINSYTAATLFSEVKTIKTLMEKNDAEQLAWHILNHLLPPTDQSTTETYYNLLHSAHHLSQNPKNIKVLLSRLQCCVQAIKAYSIYAPVELLEKSRVIINYFKQQLTKGEAALKEATIDRFSSLCLRIQALMPNAPGQMQQLGQDLCSKLLEMNIVSKDECEALLRQFAPQNSDSDPLYAQQILDDNVLEIMQYPSEEYPDHKERFNSTLQLMFRSLRSCDENSFIGIHQAFIRILQHATSLDVWSDKTKNIPFLLISRLPKSWINTIEFDQDLKVCINLLVRSKYFSSIKPPELLRFIELLIHCKKPLLIELLWDELKRLYSQDGFYRICKEICSSKDAVLIRMVHKLAFQITPPDIQLCFHVLDGCVSTSDPRLFDIVKDILQKSDMLENTLDVDDIIDLFQRTFKYIADLSEVDKNPKRLLEYAETLHSNYKKFVKKYDSSLTHEETADILQNLCLTLANSKNKSFLTIVSDQIAKHPISLNMETYQAIFKALWINVAKTSPELAYKIVNIYLSNIDNLKTFYEKDAPIQFLIGLNNIDNLLPHIFIEISTHLIRVNDFTKLKILFDLASKHLSEKQFKIIHEPIRKSFMDLTTSIGKLEPLENKLLIEKTKLFVLYLPFIREQDFAIMHATLKKLVERTYTERCDGSYVDTLPLIDLIEKATWLYPRYDYRISELEALIIDLQCHFKAFDYSAISLERLQHLTVSTKLSDPKSLQYLLKAFLTVLDKMLMRAISDPTDKAKKETLMAFFVKLDLLCHSIVSHHSMDDLKQFLDFTWIILRRLKQYPIMLEELNTVAKQSITKTKEMKVKKKDFQKTAIEMFADMTAELENTASKHPLREPSYTTLNKAAYHLKDADFKIAISWAAKDIFVESWTYCFTKLTELYTLIVKSPKFRNQLIEQIKLMKPDMS